MLQRDFQLARTQNPRKLGIVQYLSDLMAQDGVHFRGVGVGCEGRLGVRVRVRGGLIQIGARLNLQPPLFPTIKRTWHPINPRLLVRRHVAPCAAGYKERL